MQFLSGAFFIFLPIVFTVYHLAQKQYRYIVLLAANLIFYAWSDITVLPVLGLTTLLTYAGGLLLGRKKSRGIYALFFTLNILILAVYKYTGFFFECAEGIGSLFGGAALKPQPFSLVAPLGLSFYIFQSTSYLGDTYRKDFPPEKNFFRYAAFVSFFPTILSGPIQRSRDLIPMIEHPSDFSFDRARKGVILLVWGFFEKIVVANKLLAFVNLIFDNYKSFSGEYHIAAALCFSIYIYSDFSSYSDMAAGAAKLLGFDIKTNFKNPYLSETLADFWNRWHMTLNTWFLENVYIPLGGSRKGKFRKYLNIMTVFLISGLWHGASLSFVIWGGLNGLLRILGELTAPLRHAAYKICKIDDESLAVRLFRKAFVFATITLTWVFFRMPTAADAWRFICGMFTTSPLSLFDRRVFAVTGDITDANAFLVIVAVFTAVQILRRKEKKYYGVFASQPLFAQTCCLAVLIFVTLLTAFSGTAEINTQFVYYKF